MENSLDTGVRGYDGWIFIRRRESRFQRVFLPLLLVVILASWGCQSGEERGAYGPPLKISLALVPFSYSGLIAIADDKGFFREYGLEVSEKEYPSGLAAVEALCRGEAQLATGADMVMAAKAFDNPSLRVVASIGTSGANEIVARRDRNIHVPSDLRGKRVGMSLGTSSEYYLGAFLLAHGIPSSEATAVDVPPGRIVEAIVGGEIDALSSWDVNVYSAKKRLGENAVSWDAQNYLDWYWLLITNAELTQSPEPIKRFLGALVKAENFVLAHEDEAKNILMGRWGFGPEFMRQVWDKTRLSVAINQSMVISIENFARWKMDREKVHGDLPNFRNYIYTDALDAIEPRAVTIFR